MIIKTSVQQQWNITYLNTRMEQIDLDFNGTPRHRSWYDHSKSWEDDKRGWYERVINKNTHQGIRSMLEEVVDYLYENVDCCERHCRWTFNTNSIKVKFRYERDAILFTLRF
jgi:hypothetical protein